jgi:hypothetical protein
MSDAQGTILDESPIIGSKFTDTRTRSKTTTPDLVGNLITNEIYIQRILIELPGEEATKEGSNVRPDGF